MKQMSPFSWAILIILAIFGVFGFMFILSSVFDWDIALFANMSIIFANGVVTVTVIEVILIIVIIVACASFPKMTKELVEEEEANVVCTSNDSCYKVTINEDPAGDVASVQLTKLPKSQP